MFDFNQYSSLLLVGFVPGVVFSVLLLVRGWREERVSDYFAAGILLVGSLYVAQWMLGFANWYDAHDWRTTFMFYLKWDNLALLGPLVWFYFRSVTNTDFRWKGRYWWHFLIWGIYIAQPFVVFLYDWGYTRLLLGQPFEYFYGTRGPASEWDNTTSLVPYALIYVTIRVQIIVYLVLSVRHYRRYQHYLREQFSNVGRLQLPGLGYLLYLLLAGIAITFLLEAGNVIFKTNSYVDSWDRYFTMSVMIFFSAIQLHAIDPQLTRGLRFTETDPAPAPPPPPDPELQRWAAKLTARLASHEDYLDPEIKLGELAARVGTNGSILSRVINTVHGMNFNDFINGHRCEKFLEKIAAGEQERHTLLSLALDCGFNSKSTFNRAFRKRYGHSPNHHLARVKT